MESRGSETITESANASIVGKYYVLIQDVAKIDDIFENLR
jgi:hypothetical protein